MISIFYRTVNVAATFQILLQYGCTSNGIADYKYNALLVLVLLISLYYSTHMFTAEVVVFLVLVECWLKNSSSSAVRNTTTKHEFSWG